MSDTLKAVNKKAFEAEVDGKPTKFLVKRPDHKVAAKAQAVHNKSFRDAVEAGALVRARVDKVMRDQNLWDDAKQKLYAETVTRLLANEKKLAKGGIKYSEARDAAVSMIRDRRQLRGLNEDRNLLDQHTAEAQAENARFNYLVSAVTVYAESGKPYFKDFEDYQGREDDPVVGPAANALGKLIYGLEDDFEQRLPEWKFLIKYGFANDRLRLIRKTDGRPVDTEGRLVDEKGRLVNEAGELVDAEGNLLTEDGDYKVEFTDFIDDTAPALAVTQAFVLAAEQEGQSSI